jgi:hypothetical protein
VVHIRTTRKAACAGLPPQTEDHYYLTNLRPNTASGSFEALLRLARSHWEVENCLHHVKDRSLGEDTDRTHAGATVMARLRSLAVGALAQMSGASVPQKQIRVCADWKLAWSWMTRKKHPKNIYSL